VKKAIFLTGSMGSGKSKILQRTKLISQDGIVTKCLEYDILGLNQSGADTLSGYKKKQVFATLAKEYRGDKLVIAGEYYSKQVDIEIMSNMGFRVFCILLSVDRAEIYKRIMKRGNGGWKENTYKSNITNRVNFFKNFPYKKWIVKNNTYEQQQKAEQLLLRI